MLSIIHVDTGKEMRGGQWQLLTLAQGLRKRSHQQLIVCPAGYPLEEQSRLQGLETLSIPGSAPWDFRVILKLRRLMRSRPFQIIHAHDGRGQTLAGMASAGLPIREIASRRVTFLPTRRWTHRLKYNFTCDGIIAVSEYVRNLLVQSGVNAGKIIVIPDGIDFPALLPDDAEKSEMRARWRLGNHFVIGHVGAFTGEKGQEIAIEAVNLLPQTAPGVKLLLAGNGPLRKALETRYAPSHASNIIFAGHIADLSTFFPCLDLFVMPSRHEGLGSSTLLAMAYGLPVIASRAGGLPEIVEDGETGWLVEPGSSEQLARTLQAAIAARESLKAIGEKARRRARQFTSDIMAARTESFYLRVLKGNGAEA
ncbi:MAG: glycosyltransferase family 4 protein [Terriglobia bacterium]